MLVLTGENGSSGLHLRQTDRTLQLCLLLWYGFQQVVHYSVGFNVRLGMITIIVWSRLDGCIILRHNMGLFLWNSSSLLWILLLGRFERSMCLTWQRNFVGFFGSVRERKTGLTIGLWVPLSHLENVLSLSLTKDQLVLPCTWYYIWVRWKLSRRIIFFP